MSNARDIASGAKFVDTAGDTMTGNLSITGDLFVTNSTNAKLSVSDQIGEVGDGNLAFQAQNTAGSALKPMGFRAEDIRFATGSNERMRIDNSGRVTKSNQPQFIFQGSYNNWTTINQSGQWLTLTGNTGVATSTNYEIAMNWTSSRSGGYNPSGNGINATTGLYTAPVTGTYMFAFQTYVLKQDSASEYYHINSFINGTNQMDYTIYGYGMGSTTYSTPEITKIVRLSANDTFAFRLYTNQSASFKILPHYTCLAGYLLS